MRAGELDTDFLFRGAAIVNPDPNNISTATECCAAVVLGDGKVVVKCAKLGLQGKKVPVIFSATEFGRGLHAIRDDAEGKWAKASAKLAETLDSACPSFTLPNSIPGTCAHGPTPPVCFRRKVDCGVCHMFRDMNDLEIDCDVIDDGVSDSSCL